MNITKYLRKLRSSLIVKNSFYTFLVQGANYIIPLIIIPFLTRNIGKDGYGKIAFTQSFVLLANIINEYGFSFSATRDIAKNKHNINEVSKITSLTIQSRLLLLILTYIVMLPLILFIPIFHNNIDLFVISYLLLLSVSLNSDWFFLGIEYVKMSTLVTILGKVLLVICVLVFIKKGTDASFYLLLLSITTLGANLVNLKYILRTTEFKKASFKEIIHNLKSSISLFIFKFTVSLYTNANIFIVGLILTPGEVGIYAGAEKITKSIVSLWAPLSNVIYPRINNLLTHDFYKAKRLMRIVLVSYACAGLFLTAILYLGAKYVVIILLGEKFASSVEIVKILSPIIFLIAVSNVTGILWLLPLKRDKYFNYVIFSAAIMNLAIGIPLTLILGPKGMAISVLISEGFVTICSLYLISKIKENQIV